LTVLRGQDCPPRPLIKQLAGWYTRNSIPETKEREMFKELSAELLDLTATEKGYGHALYATVDDDPGCSGCCSSSIVLCCSIQLCW